MTEPQHKTDEHEGSPQHAPQNGIVFILVDVRGIYRTNSPTSWTMEGPREYENTTLFAVALNEGNRVLAYGCNGGLQEFALGQFCVSSADANGGCVHVVARLNPDNSLSFAPPLFEERRKKGRSYMTAAEFRKHREEPPCIHQLPRTAAKETVSFEDLVARLSSLPSDAYEVCKLLRSFHKGPRIVKGNPSKEDRLMRGTFFFYLHPWTPETGRGWGWGDASRSCIVMNNGVVISDVNTTPKKDESLRKKAEECLRQNQYRSCDGKPASFNVCSTSGATLIFSGYLCASMKNTEKEVSRFSDYAQLLASSIGCRADGPRCNVSWAKTDRKP